MKGSQGIVDVLIQEMNAKKEISGLNYLNRKYEQTCSFDKTLSY